MALKLKRRHVRSCIQAKALRDAGHSPDCTCHECSKYAFDNYTKEADEERKGAQRVRKCECPIYMYGVGPNGKRQREISTGTHTWDAARQVIRLWEQTSSTHAVPAPAGLPPALPDTSESVLIVAALSAWVASVKSHKGMCAATERAYKKFTNAFSMHCHANGITDLAQLRATHVDTLFASWAGKAYNTRCQALSRLKQFLRYASTPTRGWISPQLYQHAVDEYSIRPNREDDGGVDRHPFSEEELARIFAACQKMPEYRPGKGRQPFSGRDINLFMQMMLATGMRISDAATFDVSRHLKDSGAIAKLAHKNKRTFHGYLRPELADALRARAKQHGPVCFRIGSEKLESMTTAWRQRIQTVFELAGEFAQPAEPHRFRHTFVRRQLTDGVRWEDIADMLGDDVDTVKRYYGKWGNEREERLMDILKSSRWNQPEQAAAKVIPIQKRSA